MKCKIKDVSNDSGYIKKLHRFFYDLDKDFVPNLKQYFFYISIGKAFAILNGSKVVGGLVMYSIPTQNVVLNYYVPEEERKGSLSLRTLEIILWFKDQHRDKVMLIKSKDVTPYRQFTKHYKDDLYILVIPDRRWS